MNPALLAIISLRSLGLLFTLQGQGKTGDALNLLATGIESGLDVDAHMQRVADALKSGQPKDWDAAHASIEADSALLQGPGG